MRSTRGKSSKRDESSEDRYFLIESKNHLYVTAKEDLLVGHAPVKVGDEVKFRFGSRLQLTGKILDSSVEEQPMIDKSKTVLKESRKKAQKDESFHADRPRQAAVQQKQAMKQAAMDPKSSQTSKKEAEKKKKQELKLKKVIAEIELEKMLMSGRDGDGKLVETEDRVDGTEVEVTSEHLAIPSTSKSENSSRIAPEINKSESKQCKSKKMKKFKASSSESTSDNDSDSTSSSSSSSDNSSVYAQSPKSRSTGNAQDLKKLREVASKSPSDEKGSNSESEHPETDHEGETGRDEQLHDSSKTDEFQYDAFGGNSPEGLDLESEKQQESLAIKNYEKSEKEVADLNPGNNAIDSVTEMDESDASDKEKKKKSKKRKHKKKQKKHRRVSKEESESDNETDGCKKLKRKKRKRESSQSSSDEQEQKTCKVRRNLEVYEGINYKVKKETDGAVKIHPDYEAYIKETDLKEAKNKSKSTSQFVRKMVGMVYTLEALQNSTPTGFPPRGKGKNHYKNMKALPRLHPDGRDAIIALAKDLQDTNKSWRPKASETTIVNTFASRCCDLREK